MQSYVRYFLRSLYQLMQHFSLISNIPIKTKESPLHSKKLYLCLNIKGNNKAFQKRSPIGLRISQNQ